MMESTAESTTFPSEMSIPHLLLNEHLLNAHSRVVNSINLPTHRPSLITSCYRPNTSRSIMNIVLLPNSLATLSTLTSFPIEIRRRHVVGIAIFVPHEASQAISLDELALRCGV